MSERDAQDQSDQSQGERDEHAEGREGDLVLDYDLDAPPQKVWRAVSIPELREAWLPGSDLASEKPVATEPGRDISYAIRENDPPFLESTVTFQVRSNRDGGTNLRVIHRLVGARLAQRPPPAANSNSPPLMRAA